MADWTQASSQIEHYIELAEQKRDRLLTQAANIICKAEGLRDSVEHAQFFLKGKSSISPAEIDETFNFYKELSKEL